MPTPNNKYDREHQRRLEAIQRQVDAIYSEAVKEAAAIGVTIDMPADAEKPFSFDDYPLTEKRVNELLKSLRQQLHTAIVNSVRSSWTLANNKNNELCNVVFGNNVNKLTKEQYRRYYSTNGKALDAFIHRKENGMNLSDRVWHYSDLFKREIEMGLDLGIRGGKDAAEMARELRQYLRHPDKLFRRVRDEHGMLHLSKAAADFHPGRGVYRSSYMNARRLAATETNMAYRTADHERWKRMDFVVGIEIKLSSNHTCLGRDGKPHPFTDICDELKGRYPKDFKFTGWHPHCRCFATSILKSDKEIAEDTKKILRGEEVTGESENTVEDVPKGFRDWLKDNEERIGLAKSLPYFLRDNGSMKDGVYTLNEVSREVISTPKAEPTQEEQEKTYQGNKKRILDLYDAINNGNLPAGVNDTLRDIEDSNELYDFDDANRRIKLLETAAARHAARTPEQIADIKRRWDASGKLEKITRPAKQYKGDNVRADVRSRLNHWADVIEEAYDGAMSATASMFRSVASRSDETFVREILKKAREMYNTSDNVDVFKSISHLAELSQADVSCIPRRWKGKYNELVRAINANKTGDGYYSVYSEIEHAYNIYQLSKSKLAAQYGLENLSDKTPHQLFTEFRKKKADYAIPKKEFFDKFDKFIPLQTTGKKTDGAYYSPKYKHVRICLNNEDHNRRLFNSEWYEDGLFYHEFGHAYADAKQLSKDKKMNDVFKKHKAIIGKDDAKALENAINKKLKDERARIREEVKNDKTCKELVEKASQAKFLSDEYFQLKDKLYKLRDDLTAKKKYELEEKLGGLSDTVMAMIGGSRWIDPRGHHGGYFLLDDKQIAEFQAHCSENYWKGNTYFKELAPDLYDDMVKLWGGY